MPKNLFEDISLDNQESKYKALDKENRLKALAKDVDDEAVNLLNAQSKDEDWAEKVHVLYNTIEVDNPEAKKYLTKKDELNKIKAKADEILKEKIAKRNIFIQQTDEIILKLSSQDPNASSWEEKVNRIKYDVEGFTEEEKKKLKHYDLYKDMIKLIQDKDNAKRADSLIMELYKVTKKGERWVKKYRDLKNLATENVRKYMYHTKLFEELDGEEIYVLNAAQIDPYIEVLDVASRCQSYSDVSVSLVGKFNVLNKQLPSLDFDITKVISDFKKKWSHLSDLVRKKVDADEEARQLAIATEQKRKADAIKAHNEMLAQIDKDIVDINKMPRNSYWLDAYNDITKRVEALEAKDKTTIKNLTTLDKMKLDVEPVTKAVKLDEEISKLYYQEDKDDDWIKKVKTAKDKITPIISKYMLSLDLLKKCEDLFTAVKYREQIAEFRDLIDSNNTETDGPTREEIKKYDFLNKYQLYDLKIDIEEMIPNFKDNWAYLSERVKVKRKEYAEIDRQNRIKEEQRQKEIKKKEKRQKAAKKAGAIFSVTKTVLYYILLVAIVAAGAVGTYFLYQYLPQFAPYGLAGTVLIGITIFLLATTKFHTLRGILYQYFLPVAISGLAISGLVLFAIDLPIEYAYGFAGGSLLGSLLIPLILSHNARHHYSKRIVRAVNFFILGMGLIAASTVFVNGLLSFDFNIYIILGFYLAAFTLDIIFNLRIPFFSIISNAIFIATAIVMAQFEKFGSLGFYLLLMILGSLLIKLIPQFIISGNTRESIYVKPMIITNSIVFALISGIAAILVGSGVSLIPTVITIGALLFAGAYFEAMLLIQFEYENDGWIAHIVLTIVAIVASVACLFIPMPGFPFVGLGIGLIVAIACLIIRLLTDLDFQVVMKILMMVGFSIGVFNIVYAFLTPGIIFYLCCAGILAVDYYLFFYVTDTYDFRYIPSFIVTMVVIVTGSVLSILFCEFGWGFFALILAIGIPNLYFTYHEEDYNGGTSAFWVLSLIFCIAGLAICLTFGILSI